MPQNTTLPPRRISLFGNVNNWAEWIDVDAIVRPLGLSGTFKVYGIDHLVKERDVPTPGVPDGLCFVYEVDAWSDWERRIRELQVFEVMLSPDMTALHLMKIAALEYQRRNGDECHYVFFDGMCVCDETIYFGMEC